MENIEPCFEIIENIFDGWDNVIISTNKPHSNAIATILKYKGKYMALTFNCKADVETIKSIDTKKLIKVDTLE